MAVSVHDYSLMGTMSVGRPLFYYSLTHIYTFLYFIILCIYMVYSLQLRAIHLWMYMGSDMPCPSGYWGLGWACPVVHRRHTLCIRRLSSIPDVMSPMRVLHLHTRYMRKCLASIPEQFLLLRCDAGRNLWLHLCYICIRSEITLLHIHSFIFSPWNATLWFLVATCTMQYQVGFLSN